MAIEPKEEGSLVKDIVTDSKELSKMCAPIMTLQDNPVLDEICMSLVETYKQHADKCVGLSANQLGFNKRVIIVRMRHSYVLMINPEVTPIKIFGRIRKKETCLSFPDKVSKVNRYKRVRVSYEPYSIKPVKRMAHTYRGIEARIIQHEVDHLNGLCV